MGQGPGRGGTPEGQPRGKLGLGGGVGRRGRAQRMRLKHTAAILERRRCLGIGAVWASELRLEVRLVLCLLSTATLACSCHPGAANSVPPLPSPCLGTAGAKNSCYDLRCSQEVKERHRGRTWRAAEGTRPRGILNLCVLPVHERKKWGTVRASDLQKDVEHLLPIVKVIQTSFH